MDAARSFHEAEHVGPCNSTWDASASRCSFLACPRPDETMSPRGAECQYSIDMSAMFMYVLLRRTWAHHIRDQCCSLNSFRHCVS